MMLDPFVKLNEIDASLQELSIGNQKCDVTNDADDDPTPTPTSHDPYVSSFLPRRHTKIHLKSWIK